MASHEIPGVVVQILREPPDAAFPAPEYLGYQVGSGNVLGDGSDDTYIGLPARPEWPDITYNYNNWVQVEFNLASIDPSSVTAIGFRFRASGGTTGGLIAGYTGVPVFWSVVPELGPTPVIGYHILAPDPDSFDLVFGPTLTSTPATSELWIPRAYLESLPPGIGMTWQEMVDLVFKCAMREDSHSLGFFNSAREDLGGEECKLYEWVMLVEAGETVIQAGFGNVRRRFS